MPEEQSFKIKLESRYYQFVEFLNNLIIENPFTEILLILPNLAMIADMLSKLKQESRLILQLTQLDASHFVKSVIDVLSILKYVMPFIMLIIVCIPIIIFLWLIFDTFWNGNEKPQIGKHRKQFERSSLFRFLRLLAVTYRYTFFPFIVSISSKSLFDQNLILRFLSYILLGIAPVTYLIWEYHLLEINWQNPAINIKILMHINFPYHLIDNFFIFSYLLIVNQISPLPSFIMGIVIYLIRIGIAYYFPYLDPIVLKQQLFVLISCQIIQVGLLLAFFSDHTLLVLAFTFFLIFVFTFVKKGIQHQIQYINLETLQSDKVSFESLKAIIWRDGLFTYVFRELIFLQRKSNSYRKDLIIRILKQKCFHQQQEARGGNKMTNSQDLMKFQIEFVEFLSNFLQIADHSISVLKLLMKKDPMCLIFLEQIKKLAEILELNKSILQKMFQKHDSSYQANELLLLMFKEFYNDSQFIKSIEKQNKNKIVSLAQKEAKAKLFSKKSAVIFINILDDVGKITKASKNIPFLLGYDPYNLLGLSINEIIPFSIKPFHTQQLLDFIRDYSKKNRKRDQKIQFYAYNKQFHLQHIVVSYYFIMSTFDNFELSGLFRKVESEQEVIITDYYGNLQGWTMKIGQDLSLDEISITQCQMYNIFPLFPTLAKYMQKKQKVELETFMFKTSKVKSNNMIIMDYKKPPENQDKIWQKQLQVFKEFLKTDEILDVFLVKLNFETVHFCQGKVKMRKIVIRDYSRIDNHKEIQDIIKQKLQLNSDDSPDQYKVQVCKNDIQQIDQFFNQDTKNGALDSVLMEEQNNQRNHFDANFTLDSNFENFFHSTLLTTTKNFLRKATTSNLSIVDLNFSTEKEEQPTNMDEILNILNPSSSKKQNNFQPIVHKQSHKIFIVILILTLFFLGILIYDQVAFSLTQQALQQQAVKVVKRNRALMIFAKSAFNQNLTYIDQFDNGKLQQNADWMSEQSFQFKTFLGDKIEINKFYLFNIQIPATLQRSALFPQTDNTIYLEQISNNFKNIVMAFQNRFEKQQEIWESQIFYSILFTALRLCVLILGSTIYAIFFAYIYRQGQNQKKMIEAFFRFQKSDLQSKISQINRVVQTVQSKINEWHLKKQFYELVKNKEINNVQLKQYKNNYEEKIKFQISEQTQKGIGKRNYYAVVIFMIVFLITQLAFVIVYSVLIFSELQQYTSVPSQLNKASKLIVQPNLQIAKLFNQIPDQISVLYLSNVNDVLGYPIKFLPNLFPLFQQAPCLNCTFLASILTTNFRSYYSSFQQILTEKYLASDKNVTQLYLSVDVVVQKLMSALVLQNLLIIWPISLIYVFSLAVYFTFIGLLIKKMRQENHIMEQFLKYFHQETLTKNKHMNGLLDRNI